MSCLPITEKVNGKVKIRGWVCGSFTGWKYCYFSPSYKFVLYCESLYYDPLIELRRKSGESKEQFRKRAKKKLGFMPQAYCTWWRKVAKPFLDNSEGTGGKNEQRRQKMSKCGKMIPADKYERLKQVYESWRCMEDLILDTEWEKAYRTEGSKDAQEKTLLQFQFQKCAREFYLAIKDICEDQE